MSGTVEYVSWCAVVYFHNSGCDGERGRFFWKSVEWVARCLCAAALGNELMMILSTFLRLNKSPSHVTCQ